MRICFYFEGCGDHRDVHVRTHSFPTRRSSDLTDAPRLIDLRWGDPSHPKVTLVGKGVCFDTGGYDIKPSGGMLTMKKDMRSEEHTSELQSLMRISYAGCCLKNTIRQSRQWNVGNQVTTTITKSRHSFAN